MQENSGLDVGAPPSVRKGSPTRTPSHPGRVLLRFEKNPGFDVGESRFGCRSTALGAQRESSQSTFAPGAGAPTVREESGIGCRRTPVGLWEHRRRCEGQSNQRTFAPGAGAPAVRGEFRFGCRSTALGAKGESSQNTFAPASGAPTVREGPPVWV